MTETLEQAVVFPCNGESMLGIFHPAECERRRRLGLLIVVGGPQYRVGSHRQFVLLARQVAHAGFPVFRFDLRGMGDSTGPETTFEDSGPDIQAAVMAFYEAEPHLEGIVLWGLCDAASSILMNVADNPEVRGMILLNPWVRNEATLASSRINNYYGKKLFSRVFWGRLLSGQVAISESAKGFLSDVGNKFLLKKQLGEPIGDGRDRVRTSSDFRDKMLNGLCKFGAPVMFVLSGADLTAGEFVELAKRHSYWRAAMDRPGVLVRNLDAADHTFSSAQWRGAVEQWTVDWLSTLEDSKTDQSALVADRRPNAE